MQGNDAGETLSFHASDLTLPKHSSVHRELELYTELMHWCKAMDRKAYTTLTKVYTNSLRKLYELDIKQFFEEAKQQISGMREKKGKYINCSIQKITASNLSPEISHVIVNKE